MSIALKLLLKKLPLMEKTKSCRDPEKKENNLPPD
jgi:hypothetical protein